MEWTSWIGRRRPVEDDALRIMVVLHQLGDSVDTADIATRLVGENRLRHLDHLVRHPIDLAFVLILDASRRSSAGSSVLKRDIRALSSAGRQTGSAATRIHHLGRVSWQRWDDVWAHLGCRDLLRVRAEGSDFVYLLTESGAEHLKSHYLTEASLAAHVERCRILDKHLSWRHHRSGNLDLRDLAGRLDEFYREQRLTVEDDLLSRLFQRTFNEPL